MQPDNRDETIAKQGWGSAPDHRPHPTPFISAGYADPPPKNAARAGSSMPPPSLVLLFCVFVFYFLAVMFVLRFVLRCALLCCFVLFRPWGEVSWGFVMAMKNYSIRLDEGQMARVDALSLGRSVFIRDAISAALSGGVLEEASSFGRGKAVKVPDPVVEAVAEAVSTPRAVKPEAVRRVSTVVSPRAQDRKDLLELLRGRRLTSRQARGELDWPGLRYDNAEGALLRSGLVVAVDGALVVQ